MTRYHVICNSDIAHIICPHPVSINQSSKQSYFRLRKIPVSFPKLLWAEVNIPIGWNLGWQVWFCEWLIDMDVCGKNEEVIIRLHKVGLIWIIFGSLDYYVLHHMCCMLTVCACCSWCSGEVSLWESCCCPALAETRSTKSCAQSRGWNCFVSILIQCDATWF